jgi:hypothetical protein
MDPYKELVTEFLTNDFVNEYEYHKECVEKLNHELREQAIPFTYTYDSYCKELLDRFLMVIDQYFTSAELADEFFNSYNHIVESTLEQMKTSKIGA